MTDGAPKERDLSGSSRDAAVDLTEQERPAAGPSDQVRLPEAIAHLARYHGLAANPVEIAQGYPVNEKGVGFSHLPEMAAQAGLSVRIEDEAPAKVAAVSLPVLVFDNEGAAKILTSRSDSTRSVTIADPLSNHERVVKLKELKRSYRKLVVYAAPLATANDTMAGDALLARKPRHWFWSAVRRFWPNYVQVVLAALLINLLGLASPLFIMNVYDRVIPNLAIPTLWALTAGVGIAIFFDFVLKLLRSRIVDETGRRVDMAVSGRLFDHILALKLSQLPKSSGALASKIREFDTVRDALTSSSVVALTDLLFIGVFLWVMWIIVGPLMLVPAIAVPVVLISTALIQWPLSRAITQTQGDAARRQGVLMEAIAGIETLKSIGAEGSFRRHWDRSVAASSRSTTRARFWSMTAVSLTAATAQLVSVVIVVWGVFLVIDGQISVGALIAANILSGRVLAPLNNVAQTLSRVIQARSALAALNEIMGFEEERVSTGQGAKRDVETVQDAVAFHQVSFTYPGSDAPALDGLSLSIRPGERVGIIGRVGSGKSTVGRLMNGLYLAKEGRVSVNGVDVRHIGPASLRQTLGYGRQDPELFTGTLRSNILMGAPMASSEMLQRAVDFSGVAAFASRHPKGLEMDIVEGGRNLSSGQRHAVAIARLLIRQPKTLFLDEPSASMDARTELELISALQNIAETGVTLIISTHRDRLLQIVDRLIVLDNGRLAADGPKDQVIEALRTQPSSHEPDGGNRAPR